MKGIPLSFVTLPFLLCMSASLAVAQPTDWCGTPEGTGIPIPPPGYQHSGPTPDVPVVFHVIRKGDGTGNLPDSTLQAQIDTLNARYAGTQVTFSLLGIGRRVAVLTDGESEAGDYRFNFTTATLPAGVYLVRAEFDAPGSETRAFTERLTVLR